MKDIFDLLDLQFSRIEKTYTDIMEYSQWQISFSTDDELIKTIDAFIFRYIKIQDVMGKKLFPYFLDSIGDYDDSMSLLDVLDRLEKMGILKKSDHWMQSRKLRNILTHDYPDNTHEIIQGVSLALESYAEIKDVFFNVKEYCEARRII